jgi:prepilin-type N-terminal cleavage/methylation domain-containing protein
MNGGKRPLGYTIIEVMIVLAVSGVMFVIAASFINGKQAQTAFTAGVNEMSSQVQDLINQVQNGKYSDIPLNCQPGTPVTFPSGTTQQQGENPGCIFLGKVIHFSLNNAASDYEVASIAGSRLDNDGNAATDPVSAGAAYVNTLTTRGTVPQSLDVTKITDGNDSSLNSFVIGFLQSQGSNNDPGNGKPVRLENGAQTVSLYYVQGASANSFSSQGLSASNLKPVNQAKICITDGTRYAELLIGDNNNQLNVSIRMDGTDRAGPCV